MSSVYKITSSEIAENGVDSQPHYLSGDPDENQRIFDRLPTFIAERYNKFVEYVFSTFENYYKKDEVATLVEDKLAETGAGEPGADGVGVQSVEQTVVSAEDSGDNVVTVTLTDGTVSEFVVKNGSKGSDGEKGADGAKGDKGETGEQGPKGDKGDTGAQGEKGETGEKGADGADGFSPAVTVSKTDKTTLITIVDKNGTQVAEINDGEDGAGSQGNWEENDSTSANYINNRTHWLETIGEDKTIFPKSNINFTTGSAVVGGFAEGGFAEGWNYKVYWNETEYDCECYLVDDMPTVGNGAMVGGTEMAEYPFCISSMGGTGCFVYKDTDTAETVSLKVESVEVEIYHKLDRNYLPDDIDSRAGVKREYGVLLEETVIDNSENDEVALFQPVGLVAGETYMVIWNGTEYECVAEDCSEMFGFSAASVGDIKFLITEGEESTGEPFVIIEVSDEAVVEEFGYCGSVMAFDGSENPTLSIEGVKEIYVPLDSRCLPDSVPYIEESSEVKYSGTLSLTKQDDGWSVAASEEKVDFIEGEIYAVTYNGATYECMCTGGGDAKITTYTLGNKNILNYSDIDTHQPFLIMEYSNADAFSFITDEETETAEIEIAHIKRSGQKVDEKMLDTLDYIIMKSNGGFKYKLWIDSSGSLLVDSIENTN